MALEGEVEDAGAGSFLYLVLLWLAGNSLRVTLLAVPPLLPRIHQQLHLTETLVGLLTVMPLTLLAVAAVPGSLLIAQVGARRALLFGLFLVAIAGALRGIGPSVAVLFVTTLLMGAGISVSQPALPSLVRQWFPRRTGRATAVYSNGFLIGEIVAASLTLPIVLPIAVHSWEVALAVWSLPVVLTAVAFLLFSPHVDRRDQDTSRSWMPDWRSAMTWRLGLIFGCASVAYFTANAFIPDFLRAHGHTELVSPALTSLNLGQLPSSLIVAAFPGRLVARRWPVVVAGILIVTSAVMCVARPSAIVYGAGLLGFSSALVFVLSLALPPLLTEPSETHRLSAAMFAITYSCSVVGSLFAGAAWDATGAPALSFTPLVVAGLLMAGLAAGTDLSAARRTRIVRV